MEFPEGYSLLVPEEEPALILSLNLETLEHESEFLSLCPLKEACLLPLSLSL